MRIPFLKKKVTNERQRYGANSHKHLRSSKPGPKLSRIFKLPNIKFAKYRFRFSSLIYISISIAIGAICYILFFSGVFSVKNIILSTDITDINDSLKRSYLNKNIFLVSIPEVESYVKESVKYSKEIFIRKIYPDSLEVRVNEVQPKFLYLDFHQYALFDEENNVIELEAIPMSLEFSAEENKYLSGELDTDSLFIQERYFESLEEEEISDFNWDEVPLEIKQRIFQEIKTQVDQKIQNYFSSQVELLNTQVGSLPIIKFYGYLNADEIIFGTDLISQSLKLKEKLFEITNYEITNVTWKNEFRAEVVLPDSKTMIFGQVPNFSIADQIEAFKILFNSKQYSQESVFDLRSTNFSGRK
ncbi:hypothetical protein KC669_00550 [Candidatus Dojkabacteria bacterium]|uniref:POTRA domain-containing protein n=1 Tax=Candidatus Dojkabacteria bacterium TaxID=2099670 RepID=A0A955LAF6_9BACT|nr:hypothetical protein [Candidatus Dojkabacteria bacterium]